LAALQRPCTPDTPCRDCGRPWATAFAIAKTLFRRLHCGEGCQGEAVWNEWYSDPPINAIRARLATANSPALTAVPSRGEANHRDDSRPPLLHDVHAMAGGRLRHAGLRWRLCEWKLCQWKLRRRSAPCGRGRHGAGIRSNGIHRAAGTGSGREARPKTFVDVQTRDDASLGRPPPREAARTYSPHDAEVDHLLFAECEATLKWLMSCQEISHVEIEQRVVDAEPEVAPEARRA